MAIEVTSFLANQSACKWLSNFFPIGQLVIQSYKRSLFLCLQNIQGDKGENR